jgi:hypothetical protein
VIRAVSVAGADGAREARDGSSGCRVWEVCRQDAAGRRLGRRTDPAGDGRQVQYFGKLLALAVGLENALRLERRGAMDWRVFAVGLWAGAEW